MNSVGRLWRLASSDHPKDENGPNSSKPIPTDDDLRLESAFSARVDHYIEIASVIFN